MWDETELEVKYNNGEKPTGKLWHGLSFILVTEEKETVRAMGLKGRRQRTVILYCFCWWATSFCSTEYVHLCLTWTVHFYISI